ncbi:glycosyltransferase [Microvirga terrestris]|uniref:Glycosyltransferase n=1 Tax=Microvirga terrestris TaxID=2791024 RepID=A0ABS0HV28_9HYPH|nr:glycosyltransferase [Microvirga terrestris]MBF9197344.1 glycosyltransferase [Microvirga terrestris]
MTSASISAAGSARLEIERLIALRGTLSVVLRVPAGAAVDGVSGIRLAQGRAAIAVPRGQWIELGAADGGMERPKPVFRPKRGKRMAAPVEAEAPKARRFLAGLPRPLASRFDLGQTVEVSLDAPRAGKAVALHMVSISPDDLADGLGAALAQVLRASGDEGGAGLIGARVAVRPLDIPRLCWIEHLVLSGTGIVANGWLANIGGQTVHAASANLETWVSNDAIQRTARPDVHAHLRGENALTSASDEHGFTFVIPAAVEGQDLYFVEVSPDRAQVTFHGPLAVSAKRDDALAMSIIRGAFGDIRSLKAEEVDRSYRHLLSTEKGEMSAQVFDFGPKLPQDRPVSSVIIPFYGDAFFMNCVHYLQRVLDDGFELVLVVDDPRIWAEVYNGLALRSTGLRVPTRLLRNLANYGYGGANNIAASLSRGDVLFLMNSDILVKDPAGLVKAAEEIRDRKRAGGRELVVGFSLLYEDNTIQHLGMTFPRSSAMGNLLVADHPMKGLPFDLYEGDPIRPAQAVTAALMALSKNLFTELGGFDLRYERGDFEDADLCLRARQRGAEIQVHVHPGLYHLERQSIPSMGDADVRSMVTYMNCAEFNRRWEAELTKPKRVFKVSTPRQTA